MPDFTNSAILLSYAAKNSSQNGQFFKTIPANFGGNKEKYLPLKIAFSVKVSGQIEMQFKSLYGFQTYFFWNPKNGTKNLSTRHHIQFSPI